MENPALHKSLLATTFVIFFVFVIVTLFASFITAGVAENELRSVFSQQSSIIEDSIENKFNLYTTVLYGIKGFFEGSEEITADEWTTYVRQLALRDRFPGINSIGYAQKAEGQDKEPIKYIINYVEPWERVSVLGFNLTSEEKRLKAIERSLESENIAITDQIKLKSDNQPGFLMLAPIYRHGEKSNVQGFAILTFNSRLVFKNIYGKREPFPNLNFKLYRGEERNENNLLYDHDPAHSLSEEGYKPKFKTESVIKINGEVLTLDIATKPDFALSPAAEKLPYVVLISGLSASFLFLGVSFYNFSRHLSSAHQKPTK